ncbi:hypothetical protein [Gottfriedia solisilvae]|uniref:hypothetical protein n=1 Tax=Gottfriedia solisilvae TaxID=1516104 RepID=UPI003D2F0D38
MKFKPQIVAFNLPLNEGSRCPKCDRKIKWGTQVIDEDGNIEMMGEECAKKLFSDDVFKKEKKRLKQEIEVDSLLDSLY